MEAYWADPGGSQRPKGQVDHDARPFTLDRLDSQSAAMATDPMTRNREAEPGALALGREEGRRQAMLDFAGDARAVVPDDDL